MHSPHYTRILTEYNTQLKELGKVNASKFYYEVVAPLISDYSLSAWHKFLKDFRVAGEIVAMKTLDNLAPNDPHAEDNLQTNLMTREAATRVGLLTSLNLGAKRIQEAMKNPENLTFKEGMQLFFGAMKAEDSRIVAIGKVRKDLRDEELFHRALEEDAYG